MSLTVRVFPVIVAWALKGPHPVVRLSCSSPLTDVNFAVTLPDASQGISVPPVVPETLPYLVQGVEGRNAAHDSWGWAVMVGPGIELVVVAVAGELVEFDVGIAVPGSCVILSPQEVNSTARNKEGTRLGHSRMRFIVLPRRWTVIGAYMPPARFCKTQVSANHKENQKHTRLTAGRYAPQYRPRPGPRRPRGTSLAL